MDYKVIISELAEAQLDHIVFYILSELSNEQAAISVLNYEEETKLRLTHVAGSLKLSDHPRLHEFRMFYDRSASPARTLHFPRLYLTRKQITRQIQSSTMAIHTPIAPYPRLAPMR